jgi:hypothetical protein
VICNPDVNTLVNMILELALETWNLSGSSDLR